MASIVALSDHRCEPLHLTVRTCLANISKDRIATRKHARRAEIVLLSAYGVGTNEIMQRSQMVANRFGGQSPVARLHKPDELTAMQGRRKQSSADIG